MNEFFCFCTPYSLTRFSKNIQEFELEIASMVVACDPVQDDPSHVASLVSVPPLQPRSPTASRARAVSVSDTSYAIIQQTVEVTFTTMLLDALQVPTAMSSGTHHAGADGTHELRADS
jgi:hypothetical protein